MSADGANNTTDGYFYGEFDYDTYAPCDFEDVKADGANNTTDGYIYGEFDYDTYAPCDSEDVKGFGQVFLPTLYSLVFILSFIGNGLVVCVLVKHRAQTNLTDICLFNLALSDLLFALTLPFYAHYTVVGQWTLGDFMCRFTTASHSTGFFSSILFMIVMTLDRYLVIMHALRVARYRTLRAGITLTVLVWTLSLSVSLPGFIFTKVTNETSGLSCHFVPENNAWKIYEVFSTIILGLVIPLLVMVVCYSRIIPTLVNMRSAKKHRVVKLIISIVVAFFLFCAPYNICLLFKFLKYEDELQDNKCNLVRNLSLAITVTETFSYTHCCLNPIIYAFVGQKFMKRAVQLLRYWVPGSQLLWGRDLSDSSHRKSSVLTRSSEVTPTFIK